jgi:hypothetical protein
MNLDDALTDLELLGCSVENVNRTGEIRVRHPRLRAPLVVNGRRKDAPRALTVAIRKLSSKEN